MAWFYPVSQPLSLLSGAKGETYLDTLIMQSQTSTNTIMESLSRLASGIHVPDLLALHEAALPVQRGLDDAVPDRLGDNVLGALLTTELQANANVAQRDAAVAETHHADAGLDDVLAQAQDQAIGAVAAERVGVLGDDRLKVLEVADAHGAHEQEVRVQRDFHCRLAEGGAVGDVAHQQLDNQQKLGRRLAEAQRAGARGSLPCRGREMLMGLGVP